MKKEKIRSEWNLGLMYKSPDDPKISKDVKQIEKAYDNFARRYKNNKRYLINSTGLLKALNDYEKLDALPNPFVYLKLLGDIESANTKAEALRNKVTQSLTNASNKIVFFNLALGKISAKKQIEFLKDKKLKKYNYFLKRIFITSKYRLSESEEKILNLKSLPAKTLWVEGQEKLLASQTIILDGKEISIGEAMNKVRGLPTKKRFETHKKIMEKLKLVSEFAESEMNAIVTDKKINDELRGYKNPYSGTILGYQNDEKAILNLVKSVTDNFSIPQRFYKIKAKMLKLRKITYADRAASVGETTRKVPFSDGLKAVRDAFGELGKKYVDILDRYMKNGQVDVFPKKGKKSGAYCWSNVNLPTYVLLNYTGDLNDVSTFAHEMGHAIHGEFSKSQPVIYQGHTISVTEVASTLFENFAFEKVFETLTEKEKIIALHDRIQDDISTIFRQIALFNFETELHLMIREKGALSKEEIGKLMNKHMKAYMGPITKFTDDDGYFFVFWSHIRRFFYVYSYAYGQLVSKALYKKYQLDHGYLSKIEKFLCAGESMSPEDIFMSTGIDTTKSGFFEDGLKSIREDIARLEKLIKKSKMK